MGITADSVVVELFAKVDGYEARMRGAASTTDSSMSSIERSAARAEGAIRRSSTGVGQAAGQIAGHLGGVSSSSSAAGIAVELLAGTLSGGLAGALVAGASVLGQYIAKLLDAKAAAEDKAAAARKLGIAEDGLGDRTLSAAAAIGVLNKAQLEDRSDKIAANARSLAGARIQQANATFQAAAAAAQLRKAEGEARLRDLEDGAIGSGPHGTKLSTHVTRAGSELSNERRSAQRQVDEANRDLQGLQNVYSSARQRFVAQAIKSDDQLGEGRIRLAAATSKADRIEAEANLTIRKAAILRDAGVISQQRYEATSAVATRSVNLARDAERAAAKGKRDSAAAAREKAAADRDADKAANEMAAANDRLDASLRSLENRFDPIASAARNYADTLQDINDEVDTGRLGPDKAIEYRFRAMAEYAAKIAEATKAASTGPVVDLGAGDRDGLDKVVKRGDDGIEFDTEQQHRDIASLADFYQRAFEGGTGSIWDTFKSIGTKIIAETLAKFTLQQLPGGSLKGLLGGVGGLLGGNGASNASLSKLVGQNSIWLSGRASGGYVSAGQMVRVNESASSGRVEGWRPQGSGTVIPLGQMDAAMGGGGATVLQTFHLDVRGAVMTADLVAQMNAIGQQAAVRGAAGGSAMARTQSTRAAKYRLGR